MITKFKRSTWIAGILAFILMVALSGAILTEVNSGNDQTIKSAEEIEIEQTLLDMHAAFDQKDFDRWVQFYTYGKSFSKEPHGIEIELSFENYMYAIRQWYGESGMAKTSSTPQVRNIHVTGDTAQAALYQSFAEVRSDGVTNSIRIYDLVKRNGQWLINHYPRALTPIFPNPKNPGVDIETMKEVLQKFEQALVAAGASAYHPEETKIKREYGSYIEELNTSISTLRQWIMSKRPIRVGGRVQESRLIYRVDPEFPEAAKIAGLTGRVRLQVAIDEDGQVADVETISGDPIFVEAAEKAVRQWRYSPTLLNGNPVKVITEVQVMFDLPGVNSSNFQEPELIHRILPEFPEVARRAGLTGSVRFQIKIDENGQVEDAKIIEGEPVFAEAAEKAVRQWQFNPALRDGTPIPFSATVEVVFNLF